MADDTTRPGFAPTGSLRSWLVLAVLVGSLVGVPVVVLAETEFGLLTGAGAFAAFGLSRQTVLGAVALLPGFALGGLSLVVMTGWE
ncbi:hypothetical protein [Halosimplex amylolyticum]|uniref:hypothetical protein n=1 Tax=Halosimplex amylolyticum TaxID=3396616 RepID=UPI003F544345